MNIGYLLFVVFSNFFDQSLVVLSTQRGAYSSLVEFISKYFIVFDTTVNGIILFLFQIYYC